MQALEKELANFGKEKDKHIRNAQAKAKKAKADTEVRLHHPVERNSLRLYVPCLVIWHAPAEAWSKTLLSRCKRHVCAENVLRALASYIWTRPKGELIKSDRRHARAAAASPAEICLAADRLHECASHPNIMLLGPSES